MFFGFGETDKASPFAQSNFNILTQSSPARVRILRHQRRLPEWRVLEWGRARIRPWPATSATRQTTAGSLRWAVKCPSQCTARCGRPITIRTRPVPGQLSTLEPPQAQCRQHHRHYQLEHWQYSHSCCPCHPSCPCRTCNRPQASPWVPPPLIIVNAHIYTIQQYC